MSPLVDSHAHLDFSDFDPDRDKVMERAQQAGIKWIVCIGSGEGIQSARKSIKLAQENSMLYSTAGIHPHDASIWGPEIRDEIWELVQKPRQVAIGEIGLDFAKDLSPREAQAIAFREQLEIAGELELPAIIHSRSAHGECFKIIKESGVKRGVMHCFSGDADLAKKMVSMGFYISIPGVITFKNARQLVEVVKEIGIDHLLIETDCPFLAPEPHRGRRNEPAYIRLVAEKIALVKGIPFEDVAIQTTANAERIFGLGAA